MFCKKVSEKLHVYQKIIVYLQPVLNSNHDYSIFMKKQHKHVTPTLTEITLLNERAECLHLENRTKNTFDYPLHKHKELEINFVEGGAGLMRIVGDSVEAIGDSDLAIVGGGLEHQWAEPQGFVEHEMHEVTIHFSRSLLGEELLANQYFKQINLLLQRSQRGICFSPTTIARVKPKLWQMANMEPGFSRFILLLEVLHELSETDEYCLLASEEFSHSAIPSDNQRIRLVLEYINKHFREDIRLQDLADLVCMTPTSFSRFFNLRTHMSVSDYIIECRLGYATRRLIDSVQTVLEICYDSGFNNVSNFNRIFKKRKGYTPTEFRRQYTLSKEAGVRYVGQLKTESPK